MLHATINTNSLISFDIKNLEKVDTSTLKKEKKSSLFKRESG
jgi:hypothetical protein